MNLIHNSLIFLITAVTIGLGVLFFSVQQTQAVAVLNQIYSTNVVSSTIGSTARQVRVDPATGKTYVLGLSTTALGAISADGSSFYTIAYDVSLPSYTSVDFAVSNSRLFITLTGGSASGVYRYDISGSAANFVASTTLAAGATSATFGDGVVYISKSTALVTYDTSLIKIASTTLSNAPSKIAYANGKLFYMTSAGRIAWNDLTSIDTTIATIGGSSIVKGLAAANDASAVYFASSTSIRKISLTLGTLWSMPTSTLVMDMNTSTGRITIINGGGVASLYDPINAVSSFAVSASSTDAILTWTTGVSDSDFRGVTIRRSSSGYPASATDGTAVTSTATVTSFTDGGLSDGTYYYSIFNQTTDGYYSSAVTSSVTIDTTAPSAPTLAAEVSGGTGVSLSWDSPATTASFVLRRSTDTYPTSVSDGTTVTSTSSSVTSFSDTGLSDAMYYYSIFAADSYGNYSSAGTASVTIDTTAPNAPTLSASATGSTVNLSWDSPATTASFVLRRSASGFPSSISDGSAVTSTTETSFSQSSLSDGVYYYSIFAADSLSNYSTAGTASVTVDTAVRSTPSSGGGGAAAVVPSAASVAAPLSFGIMKSSSPTIGLQLNANPATVRGYAVSIDPTFKDASIQPLNSITNTTITLPNKSGVYTVYLKYFSVTGQASEVFSQTITYTASSSVGTTNSAPINVNVPSAPNTFKRTLQLGSQGNDVKALQQFLNTNGYTVAQSGAGSPGKESTVYGPATAKAVTKFQEVNAVKILQPLGLKKGTGVFGSATIKALSSII